MKKLVHIGLLLCIATTVAAQENRKLLKTYDWKDLPQQFPNSQIISMDGMSVLKIENTNNATLEVSLLTITNSSFIAKADLIQYEMKYENVQIGRKYDSASKITWNYEGRLFLFQHIPPAILGGDSSTNEQGISFNGTENWTRHEFGVGSSYGQPNPTRLTLEFSLPSTGTVYLRPIKIFGHYKTTESWWTPQQISLIGGIGGSVIGCFGALLGCLAGMGKARRFVLTTMKIFITLGILLTIAGFVAVVSKQPYAVWLALLLPGVILTLVFPLTLPSIQRRYDELEIRRMTSIDTMRS